MERITPFLWFDKEAEDAAKFYIEIFDKIFGHSKITSTSYYPESAEEVTGKKAGSVMVVEFKLAGQTFTALNGGPQFKFSGAISFMVECDNQEQVDYFWEKLSKGGESGQCGWINYDKFGITWQIIPSVLGKLMSDSDPEKSSRVMEAMLKMNKIIIADLEKAYQGK